MNSPVIDDNTGFDEPAETAPRPDVDQLRKIPVWCVHSTLPISNPTTRTTSHVSIGGVSRIRWRTMPISSTMTVEPFASRRR